MPSIGYFVAKMFNFMFVKIGVINISSIRSSADEMVSAILACSFGICNTVFVCRRK
jgi:hypothetical protein